MEESKTVELLCIVIEASPALAVSAYSRDFKDALEAVLVLSSAHLLCHRSGELAIVAALPGRSEYLHVTHRDPELRFAEARHKIVEALHGFVAGATDEPVATASALGRALCHARRRAEDVDVSARVLVMKLGDDVPAHYNTMMNCIFSAQRHGVVVDACVLAPKPSVLMKQAAHLTNGIFLHVPQRATFDDLAVHLLGAFSAPISCRDELRTPLLDETDFHAACFCHSPPRMLERGWVCSICLAVYCDEEKNRICACSS